MAAALFAFAVQNVAERSDVVAASEIGFADIALDEFEPIAHAEFLRDSPGRGNPSRPIHRRDFHPRRFLRDSDSPDSRPGSHLEHAYPLLRSSQCQTISEC